jgi:hypothetical protein
MADLRNGEVIVDVPRNESQTGDAGTRKRSADSCYLQVGGSSDTYSVTVNFKSGHFCKLDHSGEPCKGNLFGKKKKYGAINVRDTDSPAQWCKHVQAALAAGEAIAEAQDITAVAFGKAPRTAVVKVADPVPAFPETESARDRLAALEDEQARLRAEIAATDAAELATAIDGLVDRYGKDAVVVAISKAA